MKKFLPLSITVLIVVAAIFLLQKQFSQKANNLAQDSVQALPVGLEVGMRAPDFILKDLDGNEVSLAEQRGKVVMLNFWALSCPYCRAEMPDMQQVYSELHSEGFMILAVNISDSPAETAAFMRRHDYTFPVLIDEDWRAGILYEAYSIPKTFLLDRQGVIRHVQYGPLNADTLRTLVKELL
ncbi:MAG: TlpA family protein disulfide reductase [Firmicutes bacterium]|mgnify:CR=1 FL=1|nr:TlpA family protein disulfide reductase [Bacillota bacterium]